MAVPESARAFVADLISRVRQSQNRWRIVFPEGNDERVVAAAGRLVRENVGQPLLVGKAPVNAPEGVQFFDPASSPLTRNYVSLYRERRRAKGITEFEAQEAVRKPEFFAALMVAAGDADGTVGGAVLSSREVLKAALQCIGPAKGTRLVSSVFVMAMPDPGAGHKGLMAFADGSVVIDPSATELAEIAIATAESTRTLIGAEPVVALLSFSTKGSGKHRQVDKVSEALRIVKARVPELNIDGELQADAALVPEVAKLKALGSTVAGRANTLIFPDLNSANIGYKLVERLAGASAMGPFLQGLAKPANDLSRGCSSDDVFHTAVVTCLQCQQALSQRP